MIRPLAAVLVVLALAATAAFAGDTLQDETASFTVRPATDLERAVRCHAGSEVVAGGFYGKVENGAAIVPVESAPDGKRRWSLHALNTGTTPGRAIGYAYCTKPPIVDAVHTAGVKAVRGLIGGGSASCSKAKGQTAISGGFAALPEGKEVHALVSKRSGDGGWQIAARNPGAGDIELTAFVTCDVRKHAPKLLTRSDTVVVADGTTDDARAQCKPREKLLSGGFEAKVTDPPHGDGYVSTSRRRTKRGWQATATALAGDVQLTAYAYCT